ncbi:ATP-binding cassette domain-containing protein [Mycoplasma nasistruthionis]|uniref:ATP-binding cassette domain-containing protein n=1 Tax=Mycoplasma nasistruthionis TaxID=353852 RepID=UPI0030B85E87
MAKLSELKAEQPVIELVDVVKEFQDKTVLHSINLKIKRGEFVTLLGPSGSGKTTIFKIIRWFWMSHTWRN